jgi:hypothetical protein
MQMYCDVWNEIFPNVRDKERKDEEIEKEYILKEQYNIRTSKTDTLIILTSEYYYEPEQVFEFIVDKLEEQYTGNDFISYIYYDRNLLKYKQPHKVIELKRFITSKLYSCCKIIETSQVRNNSNFSCEDDLLNQFINKYKNIIQYVVSFCNYDDSWKKKLFENPMSLCNMYKINGVSNLPTINYFIIT